MTTLYHLLTSSVQSLQGNLRLRPSCIDWAIKSQVWDFPVMTEWTRLISYLLHGLFIMDLSLQSIKTNNWSADYFKKLVTSMSCTLASRYSQVTLVSGYPFWQFLIDHNKGVGAALRMSTIKLNTDCICLGHLASNSWSLKESNAQSECA